MNSQSKPNEALLVTAARRQKQWRATHARPASWTAGVYQGGIMERPKPNFSVLALLFVLGVSILFRFSQNLFHFSQNVRIVDVVGLSGGGAACGAALFGFIFALLAKRP